MMLKYALITGDTHGGNCNRLRYIKENMSEYKPEETAVIILGDASFNYYLDKKEKISKAEASRYGYTVYCVRGNHEARPNEKLGMHLINDDFVGGPVWIEDDFPLIRYFCDWGIYNILGRRTLVIGGSYSVDKWYRLQNGWRWFKDEQLTDCEMAECLKNAKDKEFDLVLSHTCPRSWQPTDLFLRGIDQSAVDSSMEIWMDKLKDEMDWSLWLFGHYHQDRVELPHVEMFYAEVEDLETIENRWRKYDETGEIDWWIPKSPKFEKLN